MSSPLKIRAERTKEVDAAKNEREKKALQKKLEQAKQALGRKTK